jgi:hypothetical protein
MATAVSRACTVACSIIQDEDQQFAFCSLLRDRVGKDGYSLRMDWPGDDAGPGLPGAAAASTAAASRPPRPLPARAATAALTPAAARPPPSVQRQLASLRAEPPAGLSRGYG